MERGRQTAVLFAELIGATELYARVGDEAAHDAITRCIETLGQAAASCAARITKTIGGRVMVLAANADAAAAAAIAMQLAAADFPAMGATGLTLGVGFHYGPVIQDDNDVFGDTVNLAARLVEPAAGGQILLAAETAQSLDLAYRRAMRRLYMIPVKGRSEQVALCELVWRADQGETFYPIQSMPKQPRAKLRLEYRGKTLVLRREGDLLMIGRDGGCDLLVHDEQASRHHCTIQRRNDHFVIADQSTNGTYVTVEGEPEQLLEREELALRKRGWISFGSPRSETPEALEFVCE